MPQTVNLRLYDNAVRHQVALLRFGTGLTKKLVAIFNRRTPELVNQIVNHDPTNNGTVNQQRLQSLLMALDAIISSSVADVTKDLEKQLLDFVQHELDHTADTIKKALPFDIRIGVKSSMPIERKFTSFGYVLGVPSSDQVWAAANARPFNGKFLQDNLTVLSSAIADQVKTTISSGYMNGLTTDQIVRTLRGTAAAKFTDGVLQRSRRSIEMTTRTALNHTANVAREEIYKRNSDIISGVRWVSTLDTRTSDICIALDGQVFDAGEGPRPPAHPNCRSCTTPITKSWKELGFNIDELPPATRASMDGQVPATETYGSWLSRQSEATQNDVLGVGRAQLFRDGAVTVDKFVDDVGKPLTLAQLQSIDNRAAVNVGDIKPTKSQVALQKLADIPAIDGPTIKTIFQQVVDKKLENEISSLVNKISKSQLDNAGIQVIDFKDIRVFDKAMFRPTIATFLTDGIPNVPNALDAIAFKLDGKYYMMSRSSIHRAAAQHLLGDEIKARVVDLDSIRTAGAVQSTLKDFKPEAGSFDILQLQGQSRESIKKALEDHRHISRDTHKLLPGYIDDSSDLVLSDYTSNAYEAVNTFLRTGKSLSGDTEAITEMVSEIKSLMKPVKDDMLLYRGISEKYLGAEEKLQMASLKPGDTFQSSGFTSMSRSPMTSYSFANGSDSVMFAVRAKSGFNAIITNEHEAEVILPHGSSFRVIEVTTTVHPRTGERVKTFIMDIVKTAVKAFEFIEVKAASKNSDAERFGDYFIGKVKQA